MYRLLRFARNDVRGAAIHFNFQRGLLQNQFRRFNLQNFGDDPLRHTLFAFFAPEAYGATILRTAATAAALNGILHRNGERAQYIHFFAVVVNADAFDAAVYDARHVRNGDGCFGDVRGEYDSRAFGDFKDAVLRFAVLSTVEFQKFGAVVRFFEFGNVYTFDPEKQNDDDPMQAYKEQYHVALWLTGKRVEGSWAHQNEDSTYYELSAYVENILRRIGVKPGMLVRKKSENHIFSAGMTIENRGGKQLIEMGILTKKLQKQFGLDNPVYYAELNWTALMKVIKKNEVLYTEVPKFPAVSRDLALLVDNSVEFAQIEQVARQTEKKLLKKVELFDVYEGDKLPAGKKSYAVNFILQDEEKTMGDKQIDAIMQKLIANIKKMLGAELR